MGLFNKKEKKRVFSDEPPELPKLPEFPNFAEKEETPEDRILQLPSLPNGELGNKFSQNMIKDAVTGKKEEIGVEADEPVEEEMPVMQKPLLQKEPVKKDSAEIKAQPIFIRIDKFDEGSQTFEEVKKKIEGIEKMFSEVKRIKEKEEKELTDWAEEIKQIKEKVEKINKTIFSKI